MEPPHHAITERDWRSLAEALPDGGRLFRPGSRGYGSTRPLSNLRWAGIAPSRVAACRGPRDIAAAVTWAADRALPFALRSGGHSYAGYSATTGLLIDLSGLDDIRVDPAAGTVTAGTGVTLGQLHEALRPHGGIVPAGRCPTVALGGLILGGGIGLSSRAYGLTCDSLLATDLLTASGDVLHCSADSHNDLFWACRGGAGGTFGVNTSFLLRTQPAPPVVTLFALSWPLRDARSVLAAVQEIAREAPGEFGVRADIATSGSRPDEVAARACVIAIGQYLGPRRELERLLAPVLVPTPALGCRIRECSWWDALAAFADQPPVAAFAVRSRMVTGTLPSDAVDLIAAEITRWPGSHDEEGANAALFAVGGAVGAIPLDATAFVHRDADFILALETNWTDADPPAVSRAGLDWLDRLYAQLAPYAAESAYQNFPDPELKNWRSAYYGVNYDRLAEIKRIHDPGNVFTFDQSIH